MIGNPDDAALALTCPEAYFYDSGCARKVYLINGVVYKVDYTVFPSNEEEYANARRLAEILPAGFAIPDMTIYGDVLACEYISGIRVGECTDTLLDMKCADEPGSCFTADELDMLFSLGWSDPAYGNAIRCDGIVYLVDCE